MANKSSNQPTRKLSAQQLKAFAKSIGIDLIGIAPATLDHQDEEHLRRYVELKHHGDMEYLEDYRKRLHPQTLLAEAKSVIVMAVNYYREVEPLPEGHGRVARYAYGRDYHKVIRKLLKQLEKFIMENLPEAKCRPCVDSAPLFERAFAVKAGLGFIGKNTTLITPEFGSFVLLGEMITTLELETDKPKTGTCGTCARCLAACPTRAIIAPGQLDARRCVSYLTIEKRGDIPAEFHQLIGDKIFGCDICQEVCPYNKSRAKPLELEAFKEVTIAGSSLPLDEILAIETDEKYLERFAGSPLMRAKRTGLQRNARIVQKNIADK